MGRNSLKFSPCLIALVCWSLLCVGAQNTDNLLANQGQQAPFQQPEFNPEMFTGPGSSVESEQTKPFNTVAAEEAAVKPAEGKPEDVNKIPPLPAVDNAITPSVPGTQPFYPGQNPGQKPGSGGGKVNPVINPGQNNGGTGGGNNKLPSNLPPELAMSPLIQLLKALCGGGRMKVVHIGGGPMGIGGPGGQMGMDDDMPPFPMPLPMGMMGGMGMGMGGGPGGAFMGGGGQRFPGGRVARIMIFRRPRGQGGPGGPGGLGGPGGPGGIGGAGGFNGAGFDGGFN